MNKDGFIKAFIRFLAWVPQPFWQKCVVPVLTQLLWAIGAEPRRVTEINLKLCFPAMPEEERTLLAKESMRETLRTFFEFPYILLTDTETLLSNVVSVDGQPYVDEAEAVGKGLIFLSPHLGNWEMLGLKVGRDYPLTSLFKPGRIHVITELLHQAREGSGATLVPTNKKGVIQLFKALKQGKATGILPDQIPDLANGCEFVPLFGRQAATMTLVSGLIRKTGAQAVGCFAKRLPSGKFEIVYRPVHEDLYSADSKVSAEGLNKTIEALVAIAPEQYQWIYKRFRENAKGKTNVYKK